MPYGGLLNLMAPTRLGRTTPLLLALIAWLWAVPARAADRSGADFLRLSPDALGAATSAPVASTRGPAAAHWNPALLRGGDRPSATFTFANLFADVNYGFVGGSVPIGERHAIALAGRVLGVGGFRNVPDDVEVTAQDLAVGVGYAFCVWDGLWMGTHWEALQRELADVKARGLAGAVGIAFQGFPRLTLGTAVRHIGPELKFERVGDPLPLTVDLGASFRLGRLELAARGFKTRGLDAGGTVGFDFAIGRALKLRGSTAVGGPETAFARGRGGFGLHADRLVRLDYAFLPTDISDVHIATAEFTLPARQPGPVETWEQDVDFVKSRLSDAFVAQLGELPADSSSALYVESATQDSANALVEEALASALLDRGYRIIAAPAPEDTAAADTTAAGVAFAGMMAMDAAIEDTTATEALRADYVLSYRVVDLALHYVGRGGPFVGRRFERILSAYAYLELSRSGDAAGPTLWGRWVSVEARDDIPGRAEEGSTGDVAVKRKLIERPSRYLERFAVIGMVVSLAWLAF